MVGLARHGIRVHHRRVDQRKNQASIQVTLASGSILERPDNRGITEAAEVAWDRPAARGLAAPRSDPS